jgi:hypothetical protein
MVTKSELEPIALAVPSFRPKWEQLLKTIKDPTMIAVEFSFELSEHLVTRASAGDFSDFSLLFSALEVPLVDQTTELYDALTMGFLEDLLHKCERKNINLKHVADCITGTRMREEWNWAYNYTHADREPNDGGSTGR